MQSENVRSWLIAAALVVAVFLAYQPAWHGGFVWDDDTHLLNNPVLQPGGLFRIWVPGSYANYWPLTSTVYRLEFEMWGLNPLGFHLVNITLHAISALLLWRLLNQLRTPGALFAAAIFALHPVNVESVAWITQLKNTLSLTLALLAVLFYLGHEQRGGWWHFATSIVLFLLSALAKGMTLTLPAVLLACAWWQRGSIGRRDLLRILPYVLIGALMVGMEVFQQHLAGAVGVRSDSLLSRAAIAGCAVWFYFWKVIWPVNLIFVYPRWTIGERDVWAYLPGMLLAAILAIAWWRRHSWGRPLVMLMVCYVALLLPVLGFANIFFMEYSLVADHWQYAAMIVPCAALAALFTTLGRRRPPLSRFGRGAGGEGQLLASYALSLALLAILATLTFRQSRMYADMETLYRTTLDRNPDCWLVHNNLGNLLSDKGRFVMGRGQTDKATALYQEAIDHYHRALKAKSDYAEAHLNLGNALACLDRIDEAIIEFQEALIAKNAFVEAHCSLAQALAQRGRIEEAISHYRDAQKIDSNDLATLNDFAWLRATCSESGFCDADEAVSLAEQAYSLSKGRSPKVLDTLAAAYAEAGRFREATQAARKAFDLATRQGNTPLAEKIAARIRLYMARTPYHQPAAASSNRSTSGRAADWVSVSLLRQPDAPLVKKGDPGTENIKHGFETGCVLKLDGEYHWFTAEFPTDPLWVKTRLAHWSSRDGKAWKRLGTLYESSGNYDGIDPRAALFAPMPIYNEKNGRWDLFYSSARCKPNTATEWLNNYDMRIWRATSQVPGRHGFAGPYKDVGVVLQPGKDSGKWEGLQGVDSFFPYRVGSRWYAFHGSAKTESRPMSWMVGLATAPELSGPWRRLPGRSPVVLDKPYDVENPIVLRLKSGRFIAVFDVLSRPLAIGYTVSEDGIRWSQASYIDLKRTPNLWVNDLRTPLGLIEEPDGTFTCFYTGYGTQAYAGYGCLGVVSLKLVEKSHQQAIIDSSP